MRRPRERYPYFVSRCCVVSTPDESFRATLSTLTPDGEPATLIVTRQGLGSEGRVWITFSGAWITTAVMSDAEAERFIELVAEATRLSGWRDPVGRPGVGMKQPRRQ